MISMVVLKLESYACQWLRFWEMYLLSKIRQKYNHISVLRNYCIHSSCCSAAPQTNMESPHFFQNFYNIQNQSLKFNKNPSRFFVYTPVDDLHWDLIRDFNNFLVLSRLTNNGSFSFVKEVLCIRITTDSTFPLPTPMSRDGFHRIFKHTSLNAWRLLRYGVSPPPARVTRPVFWSRIRLSLIPVLFKILCNELASGLKSNGSFSRAENKSIKTALWES